MIGAAATVYAATNQPKAPKLPKGPLPAPALPQKPTQGPAYKGADAAERAAGGTLLAKAREQEIGDGATSVRKSLLGQ